jgi:phospholipid transport system substrate-binding protein
MMNRLIALLGAALAVTGAAFADPAKETFVRENGQKVLNALNDKSLSSEDRTAKFGEYMGQFTDMKSVANFVIGKYARRFSAEELARHQEAFQRYALAVYEVQLDQYRGETIKVVGSTVRSPTDSVVETVIRRADGKDTTVLWRVIDKGGKLQVADVALNIDGNQIWLAIEQRAQLLAVLDRNKGSADAVYKKLEQMTSKLEGEKRASLEAAQTPAVRTTTTRRG